MRFFSNLIALMFALLLAACGGGGGSAGATGGSTVPLALSTTAPANLVLSYGSSQDFTISGGAAPYSATTNNTGVAVVGLADSKITIGAVAPGSATIAIRDAKGSATNVNVVVSVRDLTTTAPPSVTLAVGPGGAQTYVVSGGVAPFTATSSNVNVASSSLSGNNLTITGVSTGSANVQLRDSFGTLVQIGVTVTSASSVPLFSTAPPSITVAVGATPTYSVGGGTAPYTATSSNAGVASATLTNNSLTITGLVPGSASVVVRDNVGALVTIGVTVPTVTTVPLFTTAPSAITLGLNSSATYTVGGGTGTYTAASSNTAVATVSLSGTSLTVSGLFAGTADVVIRDSAGSIVQVGVTVSAGQMTLNPVAAKAFIGDLLYSTISGGTAPYSVVNGFPDAADVDVGTLSGTTFTPNASGNVLRIRVKQAVGSDVIVLKDANGSSAIFTLSASTGTNLLSLSPAALTISELSPSVTLTLYGGNGNVYLFSSNPSALSVTGSVTGSATGTPVTVTTHCLTADAEVLITAIDSLGSQAISTITIKDSLSTSTCP